jgi:ECF transporter S component (folate family)
MNKGIQYTRQIILTGLFLALALVIREFSYMIYIGGAPGMRISFAGIFIKFPALLFGPLFGGIAAGLLDFLGFLLKPEGAFIPWLTLTAVLGGIITGFLWKLLKDIDVIKVSRGFLLSFAVIGFLGLVNHIILFFLPSSFWAKAIVLIGKSKDFSTIGLEITALIGLTLFAIDYIIQKNHNNIAIHENYLKLLIAIGVAGILVTTLNTYLLQAFIPALAKKGFLIFWIPRLIQELLMTVLQAYVVSFLLSIYQRFYKSS